MVCKFAELISFSTLAHSCYAVGLPFFFFFFFERIHIASSVIQKTLMFDHENMARDFNSNRWIPYRYAAANQPACPTAAYIQYTNICRCMTSNTNRMLNIFRPKRRTEKNDRTKCKRRCEYAKAIMKLMHEEILI